MRDDLERLCNMLVHDNKVIKSYLIPVSGSVDLFVRVSINSGFDHVSVSVRNKNGANLERCPKWNEMKFVKELFFKEDEFAFQFHPCKNDNVDIHPYVLHIWRNQKGEFPLPPKEFV